MPQFSLSPTNIKHEKDRIPNNYISETFDQIYNKNNSKYKKNNASIDSNIKFKLNENINIKQLLPNSD